MTYIVIATGKYCNHYQLVRGELRSLFIDFDHIVGVAFVGAEIFDLIM